jgi:hypothetical protein
MPLVNLASQDNFGPKKDPGYEVGLLYADSTGMGRGEFYMKLARGFPGLTSQRGRETFQGRGDFLERGAVIFHGRGDFPEMSRQRKSL